MIIPLIPIKKDPMWILYGKLLKVIDSRYFEEELARNGLISIKEVQIMLKIVLLSIFFQTTVSNVCNQVNNRSKLYKFLQIPYMPSLKKIREIYHRHSEDKYLELALKTLNKQQFKKIHNLNAIAIDSTSITLDLKFNGKYLSKESLNEKDYKRAYSTTIGHYAGFQMTLAVDHDTCKPLAILIHPGSPNDTKLFDGIMNELKKRRILRKGQLVLCDKGFYSRENYLIGINTYKIVPLLFPKKKPSILTLMDRIQHPLDYFGPEIYENKIYVYLRDKLFNLLHKWEDFKRNRWKIEKVFEFLKGELKMKNIHAYTKRSVYKQVYLNVLLMGMLISMGYKEIERMRTLVNFQ